VDILANGVNGRTILPRKANNQEEVTKVVSLANKEKSGSQL